MDPNIKHRMKNMLDGFGALFTMLFRGSLILVVAALASVILVLRISPFILAVLILWKIYTDGFYSIFNF